MFRYILIVTTAFLVLFQGAAYSQESVDGTEDLPPPPPREATHVEPETEEPAPEEQTASPVEQSFSFATMSSSSLRPEPVIEWERRQNVEERLRSYGPDILGDQIDPHTGAISFEHTDVSLPGNSALEVAVRRRRTQGLIYAENADVEFGDWELMVPRMHALSADGNWTGNRCSNSYATSFPLKGVAGNLYVNNEYSEGVIMDAPGAGGLQVLEGKLGAHWPAAATHVTTQGWWLECTTASDGGQGFIAHAPNGDTYKFDEYIPVQAKPLGTWGSVQLNRTRNILAASEVTDVHGNWVRYTYDVNGRLTKIHSNDGRQIDLGYSGASKLISQVTANGRIWQYAYAAGTYSEPANVGYTGGPNQVLDTVTLPDGRAWSFDLIDMTARAGRGTQCAQSLPRTLTVTHPYGVSGTFDLHEAVHRQSFSGGMQIAQECPNDVDIVYNGVPPTMLTVTTIETMSVTEKTLSGPNMANATWTYVYEQDPSGAGTSGSDRTNWTKVTDPSGAHITYFHYWNDEPSGGKLAERQVRQDNGAGALLEVTQTAYDLEVRVGDTFAYAGTVPDTMRQPSRVDETSVSRLGDWYKTRFEYDSVFSSPTYSHGAPLKTWAWSSTSGLWAGRRTTFTDYVHKTGQWVLTLPTKVTRNGKIFEQHGYDSAGKRLWSDLLGVRDRTYTYHTSGTQAGLVNTVKDARNRTTTLNNYKRGEPQTITRPDTVNTNSTVDNNGWVTSQTDANGNIFNYQYNTVGWPTLIDRPAGHADSVITYNNIGGGNFNQTITRGTQETTVWHDGMLRPYHTRVRPLSGGGKTIYTFKTFDIHGRETFVSFPDTVWQPSNGTDTIYDALGRPVEIEENVTPFAKTAIDYLAGPVTKTTDPMGRITNVFTRGYGAPDDGGVMKTTQWTDIITEIERDIYGNMTLVRQRGNHNGYVVNEEQTYEYDWRLRLCRHSVPQTGDTLYVYNVASELTGEARGQSGSGCAASPAALPPGARIDRTYDDLGRVTYVNYPSGTPDITIGYDDNGNVTSNTRDIAAWTYQYDALNQLTREKLVVDGRAYQTDYALNSIGALVSQTTPGSRTISFDPNGLGQATGARLGSAVRADNIVYHRNGGVQTLDYGNGLSLTNAYNARNLLTDIEVMNGGTPVVDFAYGHDTNGRITSITDGAVAGQNRTYNYDAVGRLVTANGPWGNGSFEYDSLGNLRRKTLGARIVEIEYDDVVAGVGTGRLTRARDTADGNIWRDYAYDARGNVDDNDRLTFTYDRADQPTSIGGAATGAFVYDGNYKRVKQVVNGETIYSVYSKSGAVLYRDNVTTGVATDYIRAGGKTIARIKGSNTTYLHQNHLGSPVAVTSTGGSVQWREHWTPFGEKLVDPAGNQNDEGFTGHIDDAATGLTYMQARYYDPVIGRFLSGDPVEFTVSAPQMFNRYSYILNEPINETDPTGECRPTIPGCKSFFEGLGSAPRGLFRTGKHLTREFIIAPFNENVRMQVQLENRVLQEVGRQLQESPELREQVREMIVERVKSDPAFAAGRLTGGISVNLLAGEVSGAATGVKVGQASKLGTGALFGALAASGDARELVHQGVSNASSLVEGAVFGNVEQSDAQETSDNTFQQGASGEIIYGQNCTYGCN